MSVSLHKTDTPKYVHTTLSDIRALLTIMGKSKMVKIKKKHDLMKIMACS